jgi:hypothetical protein
MEFHQVKLLVPGQYAEISLRLAKGKSLRSTSKFKETTSSPKTCCGTQSSIWVLGLQWRLLKNPHVGFPTPVAEPQSLALQRCSYQWASHGHLDDGLSLEVLPDPVHLRKPTQEKKPTLDSDNHSICFDKKHWTSSQFLIPWMNSK